MDTAYRNDRRVRPEGKGLTVEHDGQRFRVLYSPTFGWSLWMGPDLALVSDHHDSADAAVESLIGPPRVVAP